MLRRICTKLQFPPPRSLDLSHAVVIRNADLSDAVGDFAPFWTIGRSRPRHRLIRAIRAVENWDDRVPVLLHEARRHRCPFGWRCACDRLEKQAVRSREGHEELDDCLHYIGRVLSLRIKSAQKVRQFVLHLITPFAEQRRHRLPLIGDGQGERATFGHLRSPVMTPIARQALPAKHQSPSLGGSHPDRLWTAVWLRFLSGCRVSARAI